MAGMLKGIWTVSLYCKGVKAYHFIALPYAGIFSYRMVVVTRVTYTNAHNTAVKSHNDFQYVITLYALCVDCCCLSCCECCLSGTSGQVYHTSSGPRAPLLSNPDLVIYSQQYLFSALKGLVLWSQVLVSIVQRQL